MQNMCSCVCSQALQVGSLGEHRGCLGPSTKHACVIPSCGGSGGLGCPSSSRCEQSVLISSLLSCEVYTPRTGHAVVNEVGTAQPLPDAWGIKSRFPQAMLEVTPQILLAFGKPTRAHIDIHFDISIPDRGRCLLPVWRH